MDLPVLPPVKPMLAKSVAVVPDGEFLYEPKWDGFRCIVFKDGDEVELGSRNERPLTRYFPEVVEAVRTHLPARCVVDGEIVVAGEVGLDFEALLQRIHPADSRVKMLAETTPASFVAFDLLAVDGESLMDVPQAQRRERLEQLLDGAGPPVHLTPVTRDAAKAREWFTLFEGAGLDGVDRQAARRGVRPRQAHDAEDQARTDGRLRRRGLPLAQERAGRRLARARAARRRRGSCSTSGWRRRSRWPAGRRSSRSSSRTWWPRASTTRGSARSARERRPGGEPSRWNRDKDTSFVPLRPELVVEVAYDHMEGARFRHTAQFRHWRPDRDPASCTYAQLDRPVRFDLAEVLGA